MTCRTHDDRPWAGPTVWSSLESLGEFFGESALRSFGNALATHAAGTGRFACAARRTVAHGALSLHATRRRRAARRNRAAVRTPTRTRAWTSLTLRLGGLRGIGAQQAILQGSP